MIGQASKVPQSTDRHSPRRVQAKLQASTAPPGLARAPQFPGRHPLATCSADPAITALSDSLTLVVVSNISQALRHRPASTSRAKSAGIEDARKGDGYAELWIKMSDLLAEGWAGHRRMRVCFTGREVHDA